MLIVISIEVFEEKKNYENVDVSYWIHINNIYV
jgi:hypothetical protein